jgi:hypothetical protein
MSSTRQGPCQRISHHLPKVVAGAIGYPSSLPNTQFAMSTFTASDPTQVGFNWLTQLSPGAITGAVYNGACTFVLSGSFVAIYIQDAAKKIAFETKKFIRERTNTKRFFTALTMAFLSALCGGSLSGIPYSGIMKWLFGSIGFIVSGTLSFVGLIDLIIQLTDKNVAFQNEIIDLLNRLNPQYRNQINLLLQNQELNLNTLKIFLENVFTLAQQIASQGNSDSLFIEKTASEIRNEFIANGINTAAAGILASIAGIVYAEGGYIGANAILGNALQNLSNPYKIVFGIIPGLPSTVFVFLGMKNLRKLIEKLYPAMTKDRKSMAKASALVVVNAGNSTWLYSLGRTIASSNDNIFGLTLTNFGKALPPVCGIMSFTVGLNGTAPAIFPTKINVEHPELSDVIHFLHANPLPTNIIDGLKAHSFFNISQAPRQRQIAIALDERTPAATLN